MPIPCENGLYHMLCYIDCIGVAHTVPFELHKRYIGTTLPH